MFRIPPRVESYHVFDKWHVAFYGTLIGRLRRILDLGDIPLQGKDACRELEPRPLIPTSNALTCPLLFYKF